VVRAITMPISPSKFSHSHPSGRTTWPSWLFRADTGLWKKVGAGGNLAPNSSTRLR